MEQIIIHGGANRLVGEVNIEGAKNAVLPILAATLLVDSGESVLDNVPILSDTLMMKEVIAHLGVKSVFDQANKRMIIGFSDKLSFEAPYQYVHEMRASLLVMGPLLTRNKRARISMPGGCTIGVRPIDLHLKGFEALGATIKQEGGFIEAFAEKLIGTRIYLDFPSVGATQNIMMAATLAEGITILENAAKEPEIVDLANVLNKMGARIKGVGTEVIKIEGVDSLHGTTHSVLQDRIEAGTFMVAAAMTDGNVLVKNANIEHNRPLISKLQELGAKVVAEEAGVRVIGASVLKAVQVKTLPYPGFPTDLQAQLTAILAIAKGTSTVVETVFENRFQHLGEMERMNLETSIDGSHALIKGGGEICGATLAATDLRAAAALTLLGLVAKGETRIENLYYLDRGYYKFHEKLQKLGADIERIKICDSLLSEENIKITELS